MSRYKPPRLSTEYSEEELLNELRYVAEKLDETSLSMEEFEANSKLKLKRGIYKKAFGKWNNAIKKAGLIPTKETSVDNTQIFSDLKRVFDSLKRKPTKAEYDKERGYGNFSYALIKKRFGSLDKAYNQLDSYIGKNGETSLPPIPSLKTEPKKNTQFLSKSKNKPVGEVISFRGMLHAPLNENGVIFLFGLICEDLGFIVDSISPGFPDCNAKRKVDNSGKYIPVYVEFEFKSKEFFRHKHDKVQCDIIICWEHNWQNCPDDIKVIELKKEIKKLKQ